MHIWKHITFVSCFALLGVSCSWETTSENAPHQKKGIEIRTDNQKTDSAHVIQEAPEAKGTSQHASFESYWKDFRAAVLAKNKAHVAELTDFPFVDGQGEMYRDENLSSQNPEEFIRKYDELFNPALIPIIRDTQPVGEEAGLEMIPDEPMLAPDEYLLQVPDEPNSIYYPGLFFKKINGFFYLKGIPYTP